MTAAVITSIVVPVLYVAGAIALMPAFSRYRFKVNRAEYSSAKSDNEIKNISVAQAVWVSLAWPIAFFCLVGRFSLDKEEKRKADLAQQERELAIAERRLALQQAAQSFRKDHEETLWLREFNELDKKASKS